MKPEDIYELKLGQKIWFKGKERTIVFLKVEGIIHQYIMFNDNEGTNAALWVNICGDCSIEPPKQPEKIKLFRYTINYVGEFGSNEYYQTYWTTGTIGELTRTLTGYIETVLTESKEIEVKNG